MAVARLNADVIFGVGDSGDDATHWKIFDAATGGNVLWRAALSNNPAALTQNQFYRVRANQAAITQPVGSDGATEEFAKRELAGALGKGQTTEAVWMELLYVNSGTDEALTNRVQVNLTQWEITNS